MLKYKVGDIVLIKDASHDPEYDYYLELKRQAIGKIYEIVDAFHGRNEDPYCYRIDTEAGARYYFTEDEIEILSEQ